MELLNSHNYVLHGYIHTGAWPKSVWIFLVFEPVSGHSIYGKHDTVIINNTGKYS